MNLRTRLDRLETPADAATWQAPVPGKLEDYEAAVAVLLNRRPAAGVSPTVAGIVERQARIGK